MMDSEMAEKLLAAGMEEKYIRELLSGGGKGSEYTLTCQPLLPVPCSCMS